MRHSQLKTAIAILFVLVLAACGSSASVTAVPQPTPTLPTTAPTNTLPPPTIPPLPTSTPTTIPPSLTSPPPTIAPSARLEYVATIDAPDKLSRPDGLATDADNNLYVLDTRKNRVVKFDASGKFLLTWGKAGIGKGQILSLG